MTPRAKGAVGFIALTVSMLVGFEGMAPKGYHDHIDPPGVNTVCYGHIEDVRIGDKYSLVGCQEMLAEDLPRYDAMVAKCVHVPMPPHRHAAILSFTYNVGGGALCKSSVARELNAGHVKAACDALLLYTRANGKVLQGLKNRRVAERAACLRED